MMQLSEELTSTENRIAYARQAYNDAVLVYNTRQQVFPTNMIAGTFNFAPAALWEADFSGVRDTPGLTF
jgi:LemA protein